MPMPMPASTCWFRPQPRCAPRAARIGGATLALALMLAASANAETFPSRPITIHSTFGPGTPQDVIVRTAAEIMSKDLGQPVLVAPKPGAAGGVAVLAAKAAKADGYTIALTTNAALALIPHMQEFDYKPATDLTHIAQLGAFPIGIAVKSTSPYKTWADVVAKAKVEPGKITYGTPGVGSMVNIGMSQLQVMAGISLTHVPHQGVPAIIQSVMGGEVVLMATGTEWKPQVEAGGMRVLVMWTAKRHPSFPDVPTLHESGYPFDLDVSYGIVGPAGIPPAVTERLDAAFRTAMATSSVRELVARYDFIEAITDGPEFKRRTEAVEARLLPIVDKLGLRRKK